MPGNQHSDRLDRIEAAIAAFHEEFAAADRRMRERHEALAQTVGLLTHDIHDLREEQRAGFAETRRIFEITLDSIKRLENIAAAHERRLDDLESQ